MTTLIGYERDCRGRLPVFENGCYRFMNEAEHLALDCAAVREECEASIRHAAEQARLRADPEAWAATYVPHPYNTNRVSYGRGEIRPDGTTRNWPQRADGTAP